VLSSGNLAAAFAVAGFLAVALVAAVPRSPLQPVLPAGAEPSGPFRWAAGVLGIDAWGGAALAAAGVAAVALALASFLVALRASWRRELSVATVVALGAGFHVAVLMLPLLASRDVFSYAMYGRIAGVYHANPYVLTPADFPRDPAAGFVGPKWFAVPAVYGPGFTAASGILARRIGSLPDLVTAFRAIADTASLATIGLVVWLSRRLCPSRTAFAAAMVGMNPVVLFQSVASGHNDVLVMAAIAGALALVVLGRDVFATAALTIGMLVKVTAALPLLLLLVAVTARASPGSRLRAFLTHAGVSAAIVGIAAAPFWQPSDPTLGMAELAGHEGWLAPSRLLRRLAEAAGGALGVESAGSILAVIVRFAFAVALVVAVLAIARDVARRGRRGELGPDALGAVWGWVLLLLMLLGPVLLPWYVTWALPLAWLLPRVPRGVLIGVSSALAVSQWAAEPSRFPALYDVNILMGHYVITPVVTALLLWLLADLRRRLRGRAPLEDVPREVAAGGG
jgi:alpha-1,6-mannosyltransferase